MRPVAQVSGTMRQPAQYAAQRRAQIKPFPAPVAGWIANRALATPNAGGQPPGAALLENWFPTATGVIMRRGSESYAQLGDGSLPTTAVFSYKNGVQENFFATTEDTIYNITTVTESENILFVDDLGNELVTDGGDNIGALSTDGLEVVRGLSGGDWIVVQFGTSGGVFLICVNGTDPMHIYDGQFWYPIEDEDVYTLAYDGGSAAFTVGQTVTGGTSGATARIVNISGDVSSGTLIIDTLSGNFQDDEAITDPLGGAAEANGTESAAFSGLTGVDTRDFIYVWAYKNRLYFVEKDSLNYIYLGADAVTGAATRIRLSPEFKLGGALLFGSSWSIDSGSGGSGLSQSNVFVTTEGEVAVYQGLNPGDDGWSIVGVYRIGKPLGKLAHIRAGGDIVVATDIGFIPLSQALQRDVAALSPGAVSYPIEEEWNEAVAARRGGSWRCEIWPSAQMVIVALPTVNEQRAEWFVANSRTGAWAPFTGWDATCVEVFRDRCFYGSADGLVIEANITGADRGDPYTASYAPLHEDLGTPSALKLTTVARAVLRGNTRPREKLSVQKDYDIDLPAAPDATIVPASSVWGEGVWGEAVWGEQQISQTYQRWHVVNGMGYALSPALQITSGSVSPLDVELVRMDLAWEAADAIT